MRCDSCTNWPSEYWEKAQQAAAKGKSKKAANVTTEDAVSLHPDLDISIEQQSVSRPAKSCSWTPAGKKSCAAFVDNQRSLSPWASGNA